MANIELVIKTAAILASFSLLVLLLVLFPRLTDTQRAVEDAYTKCNAYYSERMEQYGIKSRLTFTIDNLTLYAINNYTGGGNNANKN